MGWRAAGRKLKIENLGRGLGRLRPANVECRYLQVPCRGRAPARPAVTAVTDSTTFRAQQAAPLRNENFVASVLILDSDSWLLNSGTAHWVVGRTYTRLRTSLCSSTSRRGPGRSLLPCRCSAFRRPLARRSSPPRNSSQRICPLPRLCALPFHMLPRFRP